MTDMTTRENVLNAATEAVVGDRNESYGSPEDNFKMTAEMWTAFLKPMLIPGVELSTTDVAALMVLLKVARLDTSPGKLDTWIDIAGYAACGGEVATLETIRS